MDRQVEKTVNCDQLINLRLSQIVKLKDNCSWIDNLENCQAICDTVSLLDGSSLNHLYTLTPFILRLTDDHRPENKLKGLLCLTNLMNCYSIGDLQSANFHQLFWSTLKILLFNNEIDLVKSLIPVLIRFIDKFTIEQSEIDKCFNQLIVNQLMYSDLNLKILYMDGVYKFLQNWPKELVKFTKKMIEICLIVIDETIRPDTYPLIVLSCQILDLIIGKTGKLSYLYADQMLLSFIKLKYNLIDTTTNNPSNLNDDQINNLNKRIESCLFNLKTNNPKLLTDYCNLIKDRLSQDEYDTHFVITFLMNCQNH